VRAWSLAAAIVLAGCSNATTQIVLVVDTDIASPDPLARIAIDVGSSETATQRFDLPLGASTTPSLPLTLTLYPRASTDVDVVVSVRAIDVDGLTILSRDVRTRFVPGSARMLRVLLAERCMGVRCGDDETCDERGCRAIAIPGEELASWPGAPPDLDGPACEAQEERCNGQDDDCDGAFDEGIDLDRDAEHCGSCGHACAGACTDGFCAGEAPTAISLGGAHSCVLRADGNVACWGWNLAGQAGFGPEVRWLPADVAGVIDADEVSAGAAHTCVRTGGAVRCFGNGTAGELGDGMLLDAIEPVSVLSAEGEALSGIAQISAGAAHTCAVTDDGRVLCWGRNDAGQLGDGGTTDRSMAVQALISGARSVSAGLRHTCAVTALGTVRCWGANESGQLGTGLPDPSPSPVDVVGIDDAIAVGVGRRHTCALRMGGTVACWGANESGQLGDGTTGPSPVPVPVAQVSGATALAVAGAGTHACAIADGAGGSGAVWCWGSNLVGQLGDGTTTTRVEPVTTMVEDAIAIGAGGSADDGTGHSCAVRASGAVVCWGEGALGRLGNDGQADAPGGTPVIGMPY